MRGGRGCPPHRGWRNWGGGCLYWRGCCHWRGGENDEENFFVSGDAPTEVDEEVEHEFDESLSIINFKSCTSDELIKFMLDFFNLADEKELLQFFVIYFAAATVEVEEEVEAANIAAWTKEIVWMKLCGGSTWGRLGDGGGGCEEGSGGWGYQVNIFVFFFFFSTQNFYIFISLF